MFYDRIRSYLNRYRGSLVVDIKLNRSSTLNFYLMGDYCIDKEVVLFHPILKVGQTIRIDDGSTERFLFRSLTDGDLVFVSFLDEKPQLFL